MAIPAARRQRNKDSLPVASGFRRVRRQRSRRPCRSALERRPDVQVGRLGRRRQPQRREDRLGHVDGLQQRLRPIRSTLAAMHGLLHPARGATREHAQDADAVGLSSARSASAIAFSANLLAASPPSPLRAAPHTDELTKTTHPRRRRAAGRAPWSAPRAPAGSPAIGGRDRQAAPRRSRRRIEAGGVHQDVEPRQRVGERRRPSARPPPRPRGRRRASDSPRRSAGGRRASACTSAPSAASAAASAPPIPPLAPVTSAMPPARARSPLMPPGRADR